MKEYRRVPLAQLRKRLKIEEYEADTPYVETSFRPAAVRIALKQHAGQPARPAVSEGTRVRNGRTVGRMEEADLGANVHASIDGTVRAVTAEYIEIESK
jgi:Na+-translocating ferredoxin:NAD+ oxidoreductase RnfC subunit